MIKLKGDNYDGEKKKADYLKSKMKKMYKECDKGVEYVFDDDVVVIFKEEQEE